MLLFKNRGSLHYNNSKKTKSSIINNFSGIDKKCNSSFLRDSIFEPSIVQTMRKKTPNSSRILTYKSPGSKTIVSLDTMSLKPPNLVDFRKKNHTDLQYIPKKEDIDDLDKNRDMVVTEEEDDESTVEYYDYEEEEDEENEEDIVPEYNNLVIGPTTIKELNAVLLETKLTIIFFYTYWCKYCEVLNPYWEIMASDKKSKSTFIKINNDYAEEIISKYDIKNIPTFLLLKRTSDTKIEIIATLTGSRIKELKSIISENENY
jgi:thioredoxin 1